MTDQTISFDEIPRTSRLFRDYLYDFERVGGFFRSGGIGIEALADHAMEIARQESPRAAVADILREQNVRAGATAATLGNLDRLQQSDSVAIVTGQQAGLFTGPLYTIFKALTAVKLARQLEARGINAVPMFWIAAEDHDFEEVNHTQILDREGHLRKITHSSATSGEGRPVGSIPLDAAIESEISELVASLPESEFMARLIGDLRESYSPGTGFAEAFARMMTRLIGHYGIILIDPMDERLKQIAGEIYRRAIDHLPDFSANLVRQSAKLETEGYHAQVHTSPELVPLFMMDEGRRTAMILGQDGLVHLKGSGKSFPFGEIVERVHQSPAHFSPNVTLRPIVQDFLLPTAAIIGGAAEIAYFAQLLPNYRLLGRLAPLILPRASEALLKKVVEGSLDNHTAAVFDETELLINEQLERLRESLQAVDPTLSEALKGGREKILYQLHNLRTRFIHNRGRRDEGTQPQIERLANSLYPHRNLQERELNVCYFLARYGYEVIDRLYEAIDPLSHDHQLVGI